MAKYGMLSVEWVMKKLTRMLITPPPPPPSPSSTHNALIVVPCHGADTHNHPHFPLPVKVVLEKMGHFGVSVRHNLERRGETEALMQTVITCLI